MMRAAASVLLFLAQRVMPQHKKEWAQAVSAELPYVHHNLTALWLALGCLTWAFREQVEYRIETLSPDSTAGLLLGALFLTHCLIPDSRLWPFVWPVAAGVISGTLSVACLPPMKAAWVSLKNGLKSGFACGLVFSIGGMGYLIAREWLHGEVISQDKWQLIPFGMAGAIVLGSGAALMANLICRRRFAGF